MNAESFAEWAFRVLNEDAKYQPFLNELQLASKEVKRKAEISSAVGTIAGKILGVGWKISTGALITFKEHSAVWIMTVRNHKPEGNVKACFFFPVSGLISDYDVKKMVITAKKQGFISRKVVDVGFESDCVGKVKMIEDKKLRSKLLSLFQNQDLCDISDWRYSPITVEVEKKNDSYVGKIEVGIASLNDEGLKTLFDSVNRIAEIVNSQLQSRVAKQQAHANTVAEVEKEKASIKVNVPEFNAVYFTDRAPLSFDFSVSDDVGQEATISAVLKDWSGKTMPVNSGEKILTEKGFYTLSITVEDAEGRKQETNTPFIVIDTNTEKLDVGVSEIHFKKQKETDVEKCVFYFAAEYDKGSEVPRGFLSWISTTGKPHNITTKIRDKKLRWLLISGDQAMVEGVGTVNKKIRVLFRAFVKSSSGPDGQLDFAGINVWDSANTNLPPIVSQEGKLTKGKIQIKRK